MAPDVGNILKMIADEEDVIANMSTIVAAPGMAQPFFDVGDDGLIVALWLVHICSGRWIYRPPCYNQCSDVLGGGATFFWNTWLIPTVVASRTT